jgi:hypothetical protein
MYGFPPRQFGGSETWLDVTAWQTFKEPMKKRIQTARDKGCQFIEFDNTDCDVCYRYRAMTS